ncbi:DUF6056 family protein [Bradyrhizobium symbiodeficiens]|uniref:DUF6056 family protein n=1 Tax=Bradyrhizobium symbiodeficiens TaxID=1404367 RepID=A0A6G9A8I0_9BRAD|nr:DUF6056 family protein [Bradyrhizobium symbiodeficiens]QIP08626.1 hypothetical protein HAV00_21245 [Bradyrhizobium symbiodeficiens]
MYNQGVIPLAARPHADRRSWIGWTLCSLFPAIFLLCLFALTSLSAPEHDDFCFAELYVRHGFVHTVSIFYHTQSGRILALWLTQLPPAISAATGVSLLSAYSLTMAASAALFLAATALAMVRAWPRTAALQLVFLTLAFASAVVSAAPSVRDLLYWLSAVTCYVPPALITILILGECVRALGGESGFSWPLSLAMALGGFAAALCNEFTGAWLLLIVSASLGARHLLGQQRQIAQHLLIATAIAIGWIIVVSAGGNSTRMEQLPNGGHVTWSVVQALVDSLAGLGRFLREPAVVAWLAAVGLIALAEPQATQPAPQRGKMLALGTIAICLACCYFEYFAHRFATGMRLIERAQNQALILLLFGSTLGVRLVVGAYSRQLRERFAAGAFRGLLGPVGMPASLALLTIVSLSLSSTAFQLRAQWQGLYPYWRESADRHALLTTSPEPVVVVPRHKWTPSLLMTADVTANADRLPNDCVARYYHKSAVYGADTPR